MPTCSLNPTSVTLGANSATSTLTITVPASAMLAPSVGRHLTELFYALWLPVSMLGIALVPGSKKELRRYYWLPCGFFLLLSTSAGGMWWRCQQQQRGKTTDELYRHRHSHFGDDAAHDSGHSYDPVADVVETLQFAGK